MMLFDLIELLRINDTGAETNAPWEGDGDQQAWRTKDIAPPPREPPALAERWWGAGVGGSPTTGREAAQPSSLFPGNMATI